MNIRSAALGTATLVILLTAGAAQSLSGTSTVDSGDIIDGQVAYADIRDNAMTGKKILDDSVTGTDVKESTLVPTCASGLSQAGDTCFTTERAAASWTTAARDCADDRLRLPSTSEAITLSRSAGSDAYIFTDTVYKDDASIYAVTANQSYALLTGDSASNIYRCVTTVGARP